MKCVSPILIKLFLLIGLLGLIAVDGKPAQAQTTDLIITGVIDGDLPGGLPKAVEFYALADISDLSLYGFGAANNGNGSDGEEFTFPADPATAGEFIYVAAEATNFNSFFGFDPDYTDEASPFALSINGDDAIELFQNGVVVDVFGDINVDGSGEAWEYADGWAYRVDGTGPDSDTFAPGNWRFSGPAALAGETDNATAATPVPLGSYSPGGGGDTPPAVSNTTPGDGATNVAVGANIEVVFNEDVTVTGNWFEISCNAGGLRAAAVSGGPQTYTLDPAVDFEAGDACTVTLFAAQITDQDGTPDNPVADFMWSFEVIQSSTCGDPASLIHDLQGSGLLSPEAGNIHTIEGIVVGDFQDDDELNGFFVQEEDSMIIGDLNVYKQEDPIAALQQAGYTNLIPDNYSFVFDGQWGSLDYIFANGLLVGQKTGAAKWSINADEPDALDYSTRFNDPSLYAPDEFRASDHDPLIVGLNLGQKSSLSLYLPAILKN